MTTVSEIPDALNALKALMLTIDPAPHDKALSAFVYPEEYKDIHVPDMDLPMVLVYQDMVEGGTYTPATWGGAFHRWIAVVEVYFCESARMNEALEAEQVAASRGWHGLTELALRANSNLSDTVHLIGRTSDGQADAKSYTYGKGGLASRDFQVLQMAIPIVQLV